MESRPSAAINVNVAAGQTKVQLNNLPLGPAGTTARGIYRTAVNGATFALVQFINDPASR